MWDPLLIKQNLAGKGKCFPMAQLVKNLPAMWENWFDPWGGRIPWRREMLSPPVFWPGELHGLYAERLSFSLSQQKMQYDFLDQVIKRWHLPSRGHPLFLEFPPLSPGTWLPVISHSGKRPRGAELSTTNSQANERGRSSPVKPWRGWSPSWHLDGSLGRGFKSEPPRKAALNSFSTELMKQSELVILDWGFMTACYVATDD